MRFRWLLWVMTVAFLWMVIRRINELEHLTQTLAGGQWQWIATAFVLQFVYFIVAALTYKSAFDTVDVKAPFGDLVALTYASIFVNSTAPSGGTAGAALFIDDMRRRGQSVTRAATGGLLALIADYGGFCILLLFGLIALFRFQSLTSYEVIAATIMFAFVGTLLVSLIIGMRRPLLLYRIFGTIEHWVNRLGGWFRHPDLLPPEWGDRYAEEFIEGAQTMVQRQLKVARTVALALLTHTINVVILYCLFLAFGVPPRLGVLIAGYTMTILFLIVSPTPNGIGIVETLMPVVYVSMGLHADEAAVISFAFRGLTFWLPLLIGFFLLRRLHMFSPGEQSVAEIGQVRIVAVLTALMGVINVISGTTPALAERLAWLAYFAPLSVSHGGHLTSVMTGFALALLSLRLWRRKRNAYRLTMVVLLASVLIHLVKGLDVEEATVSLVFALFLFSQRSHFYAVSDPPSVSHGLRVLTASTLFTLSYGVIGFYLLDRNFLVPYGLDAALQQTVVMFTQINSAGLQPVTDFGRFFVWSIYVVGGLTIGYGLISVLQPLIFRAPAGVAEQRRARAIVERFGRSSVARLALLPDKLYHFTPGGSVVAYAIHRRIAVALGDPLGPPEDALNAILDFKQFAEKNDWQVAFFQTQPTLLDLYKKCDFAELCIGREGIVDLKQLARSSQTHKGMRAVAAHMEKLGYHTQWHRPPLNDLLVDELQVISDKWLTMVQDTEKRFSFGWFDETYVRNSAVFAVHGEDNSIVAFASLLPEYQQNEIGIDLVRHRREITDETMDFLFVSLMHWAEQQGYDTVNLGMSALGDGPKPLAETTGYASLAEEDCQADGSPSPVLSLNHENFTQFYNFRGLYGSKEKFHPNWSPRYLIYPNADSLPKVISALNRLIAGEAVVVDLLRDAMGRVRNHTTVSISIRKQLPEKSSARTPRQKKLGRGQFTRKDVSE